MADLLGPLSAAWLSTSAIELAGAVLAIAYLVLAIKQRASCWAVAFLSSVLYVWVMFGARLYMESALNGFYALMAVYGFWQWRHGVAGRALAVTRWPLSRHVAALVGVLAASAITWFFLRRFTPATSPFVDSMVTWSSVFTTFLVTRKVYENWYWWLVIDSVSLCLYFTRHLYVTMLLYALYLVLIAVGLREWRRSLGAPALAAS